MATAPVRKLTANEVSHEVITAAMKVHSQLGPGLLESTYQACLQQELSKAGIHSQAQVPLPVVYDGVKLDVGYRIDLRVEGLVVAELKSIDAMAPIHHAQVLSYLKLSGKSIGLLINFNVIHLKDGIKRFVSGTNWR
ncbi:MAG TPA: GxxExxY protein [Terriglobales bacterium]|nr:GxxExxY protein [Terriglobales bacterium]